MSYYAQKIITATLQHCVTSDILNFLIASCSGMRGEDKGVYSPRRKFAGWATFRLNMPKIHKFTRQYIPVARDVRSGIQMFGCNC